MLSGLPQGSTVDAYVYAGFENNWIEPGSVGGLRNPSWDVLDLRFQYNHRFGSVATEFFVDALSVLNSQKTWRRYPGIRGDFNIDFADPWFFAPPRRFYLGVRASF